MKCEIVRQKIHGWRTNKTSYSQWARQNIGTTQGGKTSMVQIYLLYQYKLRKTW